MIDQIIQPSNVLGKSNQETMQTLGRLTDQVVSVIPRGATVGFVDYPMHINVGDLLGFLGVMDFFAENDNKISVACCLYDTRSAVWNALDNVDAIVCHGGGNFGDIYPKHQRLREDILRRYSHKRIVIMPQSFHFSSASALQESASIFQKHSDIIICVRDQYSHELARAKFSDQVLLMPDMAHRLNNWFAPIRDLESSQDTSPLSLLRRDTEARTADDQETAGVDWSNILTLREKLGIERYRSSARIRGALNLPNSNAVYSYQSTVSKIVYAVAMRLVLHGYWSTSRLHGAILGLLLDRQVKVSDNSYGKNSRYFAQWKTQVKFES